MSDGDEDDGAEGCRGQREEKTAAKDSKLGENPAADERTDQAKDDIRDAAKAAAARKLSGEPSGDEAEEKPGNQAPRPPFDDDRSVLNQCEVREHAASRVKLLSLNKCSKDRKRFLPTRSEPSVVRRRGLGVTRLTGRGQLLGHAVNGAEAEDQIAAIDWNDFTGREKFCQRI